MKARFLLSVFLLSSFFGYSQQGPGSPIAGKSTSAIVLPSVTRIIRQVNEVNLVLTVKKGNKLVDHLRKEDLSILDNGQPPALVTDFRTDTNLPLRLALVLDKSDSVRGRFRFEQRSADTFLKRILRRGDRALIVGFSEKVEFMQNATNDRRLLSRGIRRIKTGGNTALYDAISFAARELSETEENGPVNRVVIVLSDGQDNSSHIGREQLIEEVLHAETSIFTITSLDKNVCTGNPECERGDENLKAMSESSGGEFFRAAQEDDLDLVFGRIENELRKQYAISYRPQFAAPDGQFHSVKVVARRNFNVHCRKGYYAAAGSSGPQ